MPKKPIGRSVWKHWTDDNKYEEAEMQDVATHAKKEMLSDEEILKIIDTSRKQERLDRIKSIMKDADEIHKEIIEELRIKEK